MVASYVSLRKTTAWIGTHFIQASGSSRSLADFRIASMLVRPPVPPPYHLHVCSSVCQPTHLPPHPPSRFPSRRQSAHRCAYGFEQCSQIASGIDRLPGISQGMSHRASCSVRLLTRNEASGESSASVRVYTLRPLLSLWTS